MGTKSYASSLCYNMSPQNNSIYYFKPLATTVVSIRHLGNSRAASILPIWFAKWQKCVNIFFGFEILRPIQKIQCPVSFNWHPLKYVVAMYKSQGSLAVQVEIQLGHLSQAAEAAIGKYLSFTSHSRYTMGWNLFYQSIFIKVNSVQEAFAKCFAVHLLKFEICKPHEKTSKC